ncbi:MAG: hypothetical protein ACREEB_00820 [Caulobacteraceae bacterium]
MPIAAAILGAAVIGGGASLLASSNASHAASNAANANNALESQIYQSNKTLETPYIESGDTANTELQGFLGLGGDASATDAAFQNYLNSTGYEFNLNEGLDSVAQTKAASGLLASGSLAKALDAYGTGLADQYGQQYVGDLQNEVGTGAGAANALAGEGQAYAGAVSANNNNAATASANAGYAAAKSVNGVLNAGLNAYGLSQGGTSFLGGGASAGSSYNAFAPPIGG